MRRLCYSQVATACLRWAVGKGVDHKAGWVSLLARSPSDGSRRNEPTNGPCDVGDGDKGTRLTREVAYNYAKA